MNWIKRITRYWVDRLLDHLHDLEFHEMEQHASVARKAVAEIMGVRLENLESRRLIRELRERGGSDDAADMLRLMTNERTLLLNKLAQAARELDEMAARKLQLMQLLQLALEQLQKKREEDRHGTN